MNGSSERLRDAARVLRERAEAATPGPWATDRFFWKIGSTRGMPDDYWHSVEGNGEVHGALAYLGGDEEGGADAAYIATVSPPFALAVADWLDATANTEASYFDDSAAFAVADTVLGRQVEQTFRSASAQPCPADGCTLRATHTGQHR